MTRGARPGPRGRGRLRRGRRGRHSPGPVRYIDPAKVEQAIESSIRDSRDLEADVVCPAGVEQREGMRFACLATLRDGTTNTFTVDQTDDDGNVTYEGR